MQFSTRLLLLLPILISFAGFSGEPNADSIVDVLEKIDSPYKRTVRANLICRDAWQGGNYNLGIKTGKFALEQARENSFPKEEGIALKNLGIIYDYKGEFALSSKYYFQALPIFERINFKEGHADVLSNIGLLYYHQLDYPEAIKWHKKALKIRLEVGNKGRISGSYNNLAIVYLDQKKFEEAKVNMLESVRIDEELKDERGLGDSYNNLGLIYMNQKDYVLAEKYFLESLRIRKKYEDKLGLTYSAINLGTLNYRLKKDEVAEKHLLDGLKYSQEIGARNNTMHLYETLFLVYKEQNRYDLALDAFEKTKLYADSLSNEDIKAEQLKTKLKYDFDKQTLVRKKEEEKLWIGIYAATILVVIILFFAIVIFRRLRITRNQKKEIEYKNKLVEEKNTEILDSINYAKRIQTAILPSEKFFRSVFPESFIIYKPKDIVAGDFYWLEEVGDLVIFAVCDCTGHGVPGALVSVMCHNALNRSVREFNLTVPGEILDKTREIILAEFAKSEDEVNDGMDISLCALDTKTKELKWSGANNPLWILRKGTAKIEELKALKQPVGRYSNYKPFETIAIHLEEGDAIYLFTDGYADQFGGPKNKKFRGSQLEAVISQNTQHSSVIQKEILDNAFEQWKGNHEQIDDVCVMGIRLS